jgi:hypothetical protein
MDKLIFKDSKVADEAKRNVKGSQIVQMLKEKHSSLSLYQTQILFILTASQKLMYLNIDSLIFTFL